MGIKTVTYKRILNIGNYEARHLEATFEFPENTTPDWVEEESTELMEFVERKIREDHSVEIRSQLASLEREVQQLKKDRSSLKFLLESSGVKPETAEPEYPLLEAEEYEIGEGGFL
ncbi:hypothetical protein ACSQ6I_03720 [Anabaena sp. WFMT]|uniref:hypothetical protein n=1 Tax=Anabaena sp. WFMT TaxID=3449730 RepID=UPI003F2473D4